MYKNIVVFGFDNSGKTTLANQLAEYTGGTAIHSPGPLSTDEMKAFMEDNLDGHFEVRVFDRLSIIEEMVYGPVLRGCCKFDDYNYNKFILDKVDLFVFCYPGLFNTLNWGTREQMDGVKEHALEFINKYNEIAVNLKNEGYNVVEYNYLVDNYKDLIDFSDLSRAQLRSKLDLYNNLRLVGSDVFDYSELTEYIRRLEKLLKRYN